MLPPEDIHVYSIDEVLMDVTGYLNTYGLTAKELASRMILDIQRTVGITAAGGRGHQPVPGEGGHGHWRQARPARRARGCASRSWTR